MILAVIGSRTFDDYKLLDETIKEYFCDYHDYVDHNQGYVPKFSKFVSGGAIGSDSMGRIWCERYNESLKDSELEQIYSSIYMGRIEIKEFLPEWDKFGKQAAFIRNEKIIKVADVILAMWTGESRGTQHALGLAKKHKKPTFVVYF